VGIAMDGADVSDGPVHGTVAVRVCVLARRRDVGERVTHSQYRSKGRWQVCLVVFNGHARALCALRA
ncbi:hypothetical protein, partial [Salmonella enterica]|uniref:hypothetical protein n=1 Tax=Salmonella enterica TaxID=28901 RepID=UPI00398C6627